MTCPRRVRLRHMSAKTVERKTSMQHRFSYFGSLSMLPKIIKPIYFKLLRTLCAYYGFVNVKIDMIRHPLIFCCEFVVQPSWVVIA